MQHRPARVAHELKQEIGRIIARELQDPRLGLATVTDAQVSPDLRHARVFVSVFGPPETQQETMAALNHAAGFIRHALGARLRLRRSPELSFAFDASVEYGDRMARLIEEVTKEKPGFDSQSAGQDEDGRLTEV
jgi:ribosome-binding factor A